MTGIDAIKPSIGTRVYVIVLDKFMVVPAIVVEKMTRETTEGTQTQYLLNFGEQGRDRVPSSNIPNAKIVASPEAAYEALVEGVQERAKHAVVTAVDRANQRFGPDPEELLRRQRHAEQLAAQRMAQENREVIERQQQQRRPTYSPPVEVPQLPQAHFPPQREPDVPPRERPGYSMDALAAIAAEMNDEFEVDVVDAEVVEQEEKPPERPNGVRKAPKPVTQEKGAAFRPIKKHREQAGAFEASSNGSSSGSGGS